MKDCERRSLQKVTTERHRTRLTYSPSTRSLKIFWGETMIREVHAFGPGPEEKNGGFVGVMGCSPLGEGAKATFTNFELSSV
jgi:regulation of enolase protein 1 (concanavalin A-like superfamily)